MKPQYRALSLTRPVTYVTILAICMMQIGQDFPKMALLAVALGFFIASSSITLGWIPAPRRWMVGIWWAELTMAVLVNAVVGTKLTGGAVTILFYPIAVTLAMLLERRHWRIATIALWGGWALTSVPLWLTVTHAELALTIVIYGSLLAFTTSAGRLIRNLQDEKDRSEQLVKELDASRAALERAHRQLQDRLAQEQEMAVIKERQRLAREIHDSVAHGLTALIVQVQAGRKLLDVDQERARGVIEHCEEMARDALQETRRAVRALHPGGLEQQSDVEALRRLARDYGLATGMNVVVNADPTSLHMPPDPGRLEQVYRIAQEALTNAHRHGEASHVSIDLTVSRGALHVRITNDGRIPANLDPGVGMKSMRERAESVGGSFSVECCSPVLTVALTIPLRQEAAK